MKGKATILHAPSLHEQDEDDGYLGINHPSDRGRKAKIKGGDTTWFIRANITFSPPKTHSFHLIPTNFNPKLTRLTRFCSTMSPYYSLNGVFSYITTRTKLDLF